MTGEEHILCIHYYYPPIRSGGVLRNYFISIEFSKLYKWCHVLTTSNQKRLPTETLPIPSNVTSYPIYTLDFRSVLSGTKTAHVSEKKKRHSISQFLLRVQKSFPFNLFIGEGGLLYIYNAYKKGKQLIKTHKIKTIYSSAFPYADHLVAYLLKGLFGNKIRWIADFRDLQIEPIYNNVVLKGFQKWCEEKILKRADLVTSVSSGLVEKLNGYNRPTHVMPRGVNLRPEKSLMEKFTISYTGSLYKHYRNPELLFKVINACILEKEIPAEEIQILYAGRDGHQMEEYIRKYDLISNFSNKGFLSRKESLRIQNQSHINLMLTSSSKDMSGVITGKIFEYVEATRPVIILINGSKDDEIQSFVDGIRLGKVYNTEDGDSYNQLKRYFVSSFREWKNTGKLPSRLDREKVKNEMSWGHQVSKMLAEIE